MGMPQMTKYQVFISSTYKDLIPARESLIMSLLSSKYIPCGMEIFSSSSDSQFEYIKRMLNLCDYYVLILAGRYGEIGSHDISYTEMEYNYAVDNGIPILAFLHKHPENIPIKFSEKDSKMREKLGKFRKRVQNERLYKQWESPEELSTMVLSSLIEEQEIHPRPGWVRFV